MPNWGKWIGPGILVVLVLTVLSTWFRADTLENDLLVKASQQIEAEHPWASVELNGRDLTLKGTAPTDEALQNAIELVDQAYDIRVIKNETELLAEAVPYMFSAVRTDDKLVLAGHAPNSLVRQKVLAATKKQFPDTQIDDQMALGRGAPKLYEKMTDFALSQLAQMEQGSAAYSGMDFDIAGTASGLDEYDKIIKNLKRKKPKGVTIKTQEINPASVSPYIWSAEYDGKAVKLEGYAPSPDDKRAIEAGIKEQLDGVRVRNNLRIAAGAPDGFVNAADYAGGFFAGVSQGTVSLNDDKLSLEGGSKSTADYAAVIVKLGNLPNGYSLAENKIQPAAASPYVWSAKKDETGLTLSGFAPGDAARGAVVLSAINNFADVRINDEMQIAGGSEPNYDAATEFGLQVLSKLENGEVKLVGTEMELAGPAKSTEDFEALKTLLQSAPDGVNFSQTVGLPVVKPYTFSLTKADGELTISGFAPNEEVKSSVIVFASENYSGAEIIDNLQIANGVPASVDWIEAAQFALRQSKNLSSGNVAIVDDTFSVEGASATSGSYETLIQTLTSGLPAGLTLGGQNIDLPEVSPYRWSVSKSARNVTVRGNAPSRQVANAAITMVATSLGFGGIADKQVLAAGAPDGFAEIQKLVTQQLNLLEAGEASILDQQVLISGRAADEEIKSQIERLVTDGLPAGYTGSTNIVFPKPEAPLPVADPYRWSLSKTKNSISVSGNAASEADSVSITKAIEVALGVSDVTNRQALAAGKPDGFDTVRSILIEQVAKLDAGQANMVGTSVSISGRAASEEIANVIDIVLANSLPSGYAGSTNILFPQPEPEPEPVVEAKPPVAEPYRWSLSKTKAGITVSGNAESDDDSASVAKSIEDTLGVSGVSNRQSVAIGKPDEFDIVRSILIGQVAKLEAGQGNIVGTSVSVVGRATSEEIAKVIDVVLANSLPAGYTGATNILFPKPAPEPIVEPEPEPEPEPELKPEVDSEAENAPAVDADVIKPEAAPTVEADVTKPEVKAEAEVGAEAEAEVKAEVEAEAEQPEEAIVEVEPQVDEALLCQQNITAAVNGRQIFFDTNRATLKSESNDVLTSIAKAALECPDIRIEVAGHTDSRGADDFNQDLSQARANSVRAFLIDAGMASERLDAQGYGETEPIADNDNANGRAKNRRIEINVID